MENPELRYWKCMIGPIYKSKLIMGFDAPLRDAVKSRFWSMFHEHADVCVSGWGVDEEKFKLIREIECYSVDDLRHVITELKMMKDAERANNSV